MIKWFAYIVLLLMLTPRLSLAEKNGGHPVFKEHNLHLSVPNVILTDTSTSKNSKRQQEIEDKKKIKEIAKARRQPKPEKIDANANTPATQKTKPKRQRRPEGLERPPEIPRRNGN